MTEMLFQLNPITTMFSGAITKALMFTSIITTAGIDHSIIDGIPLDGIGILDGILDGILGGLDLGIQDIMATDSRIMDMGAIMVHFTLIMDMVIHRIILVITDMDITEVLPTIIITTEIV